MSTKTQKPNEAIIYIERLRLRNFAGQRDVALTFSPTGTNIYGANEAGKTTVFNAFLWLFFGKDYLDRKDYGIKPKDQNGNDIHRLETEVSGEFRVNGSLEKFRRLYKEKWTTKRGTTNEEFTGHTTDFFWNDVPLNATEYAEKVNQLIPEHLFKLLTNPMHFNAMHWEKQREILIQMAGDIPTEKVIDAISSLGNDFGHLINAINSKMSLDEYEKQLRSKINLTRKECDHLPVRINEAQRNMPEELDWVSIEKQIEALDAEIEQIDNSLNDAAARYQVRADEKIALLNEKNSLLEKYNARKFELNQQLTAERNNINSKRNQAELTLNATKGTLSQTQHEIDNKLRQIAFNNDAITQKNARRAELGDRWKEINALKFEPAHFELDPSDCNCPTCKQVLPAEQLASKTETLTANFNEAEAKRLKAFNDDVAFKKKSVEDEGSRLKNEIDSLISQNASLEAEVSSLREKLATLNAQVEQQTKALAEVDAEIASLADSAKPLDQLLKEAVEADPTCIEIRRQGNEVKAKIEAFEAGDANDERELLIQHKKDLNARIQLLKDQLALKQTIANTKARIAELEEQESKQQQEIAELERKLNDLAAYERAKMDMVEAAINQRFTVVTWKLFERQINGGEKPTCECMVKGVPYSHTNYASKVNAGLDIINAMVDHYRISAPVFIDNRESTSSIIAMHSQVINLVVSEADKTLRVVNNPSDGVVINNKPSGAAATKMADPVAMANAMQPSLDFD